MKTIATGKKISLKKEKIVSLNNYQLNQIKGGGVFTWANCDLPPINGKTTSFACDDAL